VVQFVKSQSHWAGWGCPNQTRQRHGRQRIKGVFISAGKAMGKYKEKELDCESQLCGLE
jgi:hypothetical protein